MLTERMKKCAEYYALTGIAKEEVESRLNCKWEELPKEFFEYADKCSDWCDRVSAEIDEMIEEARYLHE